MVMPGHASLESVLPLHYSGSLSLSPELQAHQLRPVVPCLERFGMREFVKIEVIEVACANALNESVDFIGGICNR